MWVRLLVSGRDGDRRQASAYSFLPMTCMDLRNLPSQPLQEPLPPRGQETCLITADRNILPSTVCLSPKPWSDPYLVRPCFNFLHIALHSTNSEELGLILERERVRI